MKTRSGLMTDTFETAWNELNTINEAWKSKAAKTADDREQAASIFYDTAKNKLAIDFDSFHKAFDADLDRLGLLSLFTEDGKLENRATYGKLKELDKEDKAVKAIIKLWVAQFSDRLPTVEERAAMLKQKELEANK